MFSRLVYILLLTAGIATGFTLFVLMAHVDLDRPYRFIYEAF